jgi:hypothetical protein
MHPGLYEQNMNHYVLADFLHVCNETPGSPIQLKFTTISMLDQIWLLLANIKVGVLDTLQVAQQQKIIV